MHSETASAMHSMYSFRSRIVTLYISIPVLNTSFGSGTSITASRLTICTTVLSDVSHSSPTAKIETTSRARKSVVLLSPSSSSYSDVTDDLRPFDDASDDTVDASVERRAFFLAPCRPCRLVMYGRSGGGGRDCGGGGRPSPAECETSRCTSWCAAGAAAAP